MTQYTFDVKYFRTATVHADNENEAVRLVLIEDDRVEWGNYEQDGDPDLLSDENDTEED